MKQTYTLFIYIAAILLMGFTACEDGNDFDSGYVASLQKQSVPNPDSDPYTKATTTEPGNTLTFDASASATGTITVTSNEGWTATSSDTSWCTVEPASGRNSGTVKVTVTENTSTDVRTAIITIKGETSGNQPTVTITQKGKDVPIEYYTKATPTELEFTTPKEATQNITVESNEEWTVSVIGDDASYFTVTNSGSNDGTVKVTASKNETAKSRNATVTITGKTSGDKTEITVTQAGVILTVSTPEIFKAEGSSQDLTVTCNTDWSATSSDTSWCTVKKNDGKLTVTAIANTTSSERTATVTVTAGNVKRDVTVTQDPSSVVDITPYGDYENWD